MTFSYTPGASLAHSLDPRTKLAVQVCLAVAAFAHTTPRGLALLTVLTGGVLLVARTSPLAALTDVRAVLPFLVAGPLLEGATFGPPWFSLAAARTPALASYRVVLLLLVSAAYVRTTPVRESRAAIQWLVPGRAGQVLGMGTAFVFRFLPVLRADLRSIRDTMRARLGSERPVTERMQLVATAGISRAFERSDRFALALRARCFAWNPTLPHLAFSWRDVPVLVFAGVLLAWALL